MNVSFIPRPYDPAWAFGVLDYNDLPEYEGGCGCGLLGYREAYNDEKERE